jgi:hypothetical protein
MKYSVEYKNGKFIETLEVNNNTVTKTWQRKNDGEISGLRSTDLEFSEQLEEIEEEDVLDYINDLFDNSMLVADVEDFVANTGVE